MPSPAPAPKRPDPHACPYCAKGLPHPAKIHVRVHVPPRPRPDIILVRSLVMFAVGVALILAGLVLDPPLTLLDNTED